VNNPFSALFIEKCKILPGKTAKFRHTILLQKIEYFRLNIEYLTSAFSGSILLGPFKKNDGATRGASA